MRKIMMVFAALLFVVFAYAQGKNGITQTAQAESTPVTAVSTAAADSSAATVESKTIKTEIQSPGVVTEYKEDGTKVVTINLSEIDETKLPEKYEAKVILEAPIVMATKEDKWITPIGTFQAGEAGRECDYDISIDEKGDIYILDPCNGRITVYNNKGKLMKTMPVVHAYTNNMDGSVKNYKKQIATTGGKVYVRDVIENKIEKLDKSGKVIETIDVPREIDGQSTWDMKMWADEDGVEVDARKPRKRKKADLGEISVKEIGKQEKEILMNNVFVKVRTKNDIFKFEQVNFDGKNSIYISLGTKGNGDESGFYKISSDGLLVAKLEVWTYWTRPEWTDNCIWRSALKENVGFDKAGNLYVFYILCCRDESCIGKIRFIKLMPSGEK